MAGQLEGKAALVTGGTTGIGLAAAKLFQAEGAWVAITGQDPGRLDAASRELGTDVLAIRADAGHVADCGIVASKVAEAFGGLDIAFLNAGMARFTPLAEMTEELFDATFAVNVKGVLFAAQALAPIMRQGGSIVVNTSVNGSMGMPGSSAYGPSKAAARALVRTLAAELAPQGIRVNAVSPGPVDTPIVGKLGFPPDQLDGLVGTLEARIPQRRRGRPEEIAAVALFLASDASSFVTGAELVADGGWTGVGS